MVLETPVKNGKAEEIVRLGKEIEEMGEEVELWKIKVTMEHKENDY